MKESSKDRPKTGKSAKVVSTLPLSGTPEARRQAAVILEVLAGVLRPAEAAQVLSTSLPRYYLLERRALTALLAACEPLPRGPRVDLARQLAALERENRRLRRECDRQQALVRVAERTLGLTRPSLPKAAKGKAGPGANGQPRRRQRRPTVRALKMVQALRAATEGVPGESETPVSPPVSN